jgi:uncharacterized protein YndB with AHSA1/START domain
MQGFHGKATEHVEATPASIFELITNVARLPEWNNAIESVAEQPQSLDKDAEWLVVMHPRRMPKWRSKSTVQEIDRDARRFAYRTVNADGNPSFTLWRWEVAPEDTGSRVTVSWDVHLSTWDRKLLAGPIRRNQLRKEVEASLPQIAPALDS